MSFNKEVLNERRMKTLNFMPQSLRFFVFIWAIDFLLLFLYVIIYQVHIWQWFGYTSISGPFAKFDPVFMRFISLIDGLIIIVYGAFVIKRKKEEFFSLRHFSKIEYVVYELKGRLAVCIGGIYFILGILLIIMSYFNG